MPDNPPQQGGNILTRKLGPLPTWAWLAIITALALGYWLLVARKKSSQQASGVPEVAIADLGQPEPPAEPASKKEDKDKDDKDKDNKKPTHHRTHRHTDRDAAPLSGSAGPMQGGKTPVPTRRHREPHKTTAGGNNPPIYK